IVSARDAADHTFAALDMRSRVDIASTIRSTERKYEGMSVLWVLTDRWQDGHEPVHAPRIVKAAWETSRDDHGDLEVALQVVQASRDADGWPMFVARTYELSSSNPRRAPAVKTSFGASATIRGI